MILRVSIPTVYGKIGDAGSRYYTLVSAGQFWNAAKRCFNPAPKKIIQHSPALDSGGFVAMKLFGGYRWTVQQYVDFVVAGVKDAPNPWAWWAQMDFCCEPEIANDAFEVTRRLHKTAEYLQACRTATEIWWNEGITDLKYPMPVLQGWFPDDYLRSIDLADNVLTGDWPALIGVGSMCRRSTTGNESLFKVLERIKSALPSYVGFHLFGVKGEALHELSKDPRVLSTDSMAWDYAAFMEARGGQFPNTTEHRAAWMHKWAEKQLAKMAKHVPNASLSPDQIASRLFDKIPDRLLYNWRALHSDEFDACLRSIIFRSLEDSHVVLPH